MLLLPPKISQDRGGQPGQVWRDILGESCLMTLTKTHGALSALPVPAHLIPSMDAW